MIGRIAVDPTNPNRVLVAASGDISDRRQARPLPHDRRRRDWKRVLTPNPPPRPTGAVDVAIDPTNPNLVYATLVGPPPQLDLRPYGGVGSGLWVTDNATARKASQDVGADRQLARPGPLPSYDASRTA